MSSFDEFDAFEASSLSARAMAARPAPYLDELNPAQREAVETLDGPVLMLAGAGTGKTKALTARVVHLLNTGRARPNEILSVTFTNKAAREMKNRISGMLGQTVEGMPWLGTFHSICVKLLRRHAELIADDSDSVVEGAGEPTGPHLKSNFTILDTDDQLRLLKQLVQAAGIDDKRWPARQLANIIDGWKNRALTPDKIPASDAGAYNHRGPELYAAYQRRLLELNAVDFGDLLLHMVTIFQTHPTSWRNTSAGSAISLWTNIRIRTSPSTCGFGSWRPRTRTSAVWATTTSRFMAGAGRKWATSCGSRRTFPARTWCGWNRTIARPRISSPLPAV